MRNTDTTAAMSDDSTGAAAADVLELVAVHADPERVAAAAGRARAALDALAATLAAVFGDAGFAPTVVEAGAVFGAVIEAVERLPTGLERAWYAESVAAVSRQRALVADCREAVRGLVGDDVPFEALAAADDALEHLRSAGVADLAEARAALAGQRACIASLAAVDEHVRQVSALLGYGDGAGFSWKRLHAAAAHAASLSLEDVLWLRRLPDGAGEVLSSFAARLEGAVAARRVLVETHGDAFLKQSVSRLRNAAAILLHPVSDRTVVAAELAFFVGVDGNEPQAAAARLADMADCLAALDDADRDVAVASLVGPSFSGRNADVSAPLGKLDKWTALVRPDAAHPEAAALARILLRGDGVATASLLAALPSAVEAVGRHEAEFGIGLDDSRLDRVAVDTFSDSIKAVETVAGHADSPFNAVFQAFRMAARVERESRILTGLEESVGADPDLAAQAIASELATRLASQHPGADFSHLVSNAASFAQSCRDGEEMVHAFAQSAVELMNIADAEVLRFSRPIAEAADPLRVLEAANVLLPARWRQQEDRRVLEAFEEQAAVIAARQAAFTVASQSASAATAPRDVTVAPPGGGAGRDGDARPSADVHASGPARQTESGSSGESAPVPDPFTVDFIEDPGFDAASLPGHGDWVEVPVVVAPRTEPV